MGGDGRGWEGVGGRMGGLELNMDHSLSPSHHTMTYLLVIIQHMSVVTYRREQSLFKELNHFSAIVKGSQMKECGHFKY